MNLETPINNGPLADEEIVKRVSGGEKQLFELLMRKYNQRLFRISKAITNSDEDAEDVMQASYISAFQQLPGFEGRSSFSTWLIRIAINESLLWKKRKMKRQQLLVGEPRPAYNTETPLKAVMNSELKVILEKAISNLPEKYRVVFVMREMEGLSVDETMEALKLSESNVKTRLNRAKETLRDSLSGYYRSEDVYAFHLSRCDKVVGVVMKRISELV